jgi:hypothetical protein
MHTSPTGDYFEWYCDWCDSKNLTLWTIFKKEEVFCGACHKILPAPFQNLSVYCGERLREYSRPGREKTGIFNDGTDKKILLKIDEHGLS